METNDLGKILTEECQKISIVDFSRQAKAKLKEAIMSSQVEVFDKNITLLTSRVNFGGVRYWFKCPLCDKRVGVLYIHPVSQKVGCRVCLGLQYRKARYKGMAEDIVAINN